VLDEIGRHVGGRNAWLHALVGPEATAYVIDPTRSGAVAERVLGAGYAGVMISRVLPCSAHAARRATLPELGQRSRFQLSPGEPVPSKVKFQFDMDTPGHID
jgi:hypothetical protein